MAEEKSERKCTCSGDLRTFVIALLTAIIVVCAYHFARGYCHMRYAIARQKVRAAAPQVIVVPCCHAPQTGPRGEFMPPPGERFQGRHGMITGRKGRMMRPEGPKDKAGCPMFKAPKCKCPECKCPECKPGECKPGNCKPEECKKACPAPKPEAKPAPAPAPAK